jgi:hypothetical protein
MDILPQRYTSRSLGMTYYLSSGSSPEDKEGGEVGLKEAPSPEAMADLRVFWGPEICRLHYLVHLLDTGRIKDEYWPTPTHTR